MTLTEGLLLIAKGFAGAFVGLIVMAAAAAAVLHLANRYARRMGEPQERAHKRTR